MEYKEKNKIAEKKQQPQWHAIYTRPRWEKKTSALLVRKNIETYCPLKVVRKQWADRKKTVLEPLFTSYVFINITDDQHLTIKQTDGVMNFVYWLGKPAIIKDIEIENIKKFLKDYEDVKVSSVEIKNNDIVRVTKGPLTMQEGRVKEIRNNTIRLLLPSMGFVLEALVEINNVEVISQGKTSLAFG